MLKVLFIDRDGTLIEEPDDEQVDSLDKVQLMPDAVVALRKLSELGYRFVMVTNQDGLGTSTFPEEDFAASHEHILAVFSSQGVHFDEVFICPHREEENCDCRKPRTGLLTQYLASYELDVDSCAVIGDRQTDMELAEAMGLRGILVSKENLRLSWGNALSKLLPGARIASETRTTRETDIQVNINLDATTPLLVNTGIGFYDHMLEQIAKHGGFSLEVYCRGDLIVDEHHTIEDTALTIGKALRKALGDKRGIARYGSQIPMDESEARVSLDLSGRSYFAFDGEFPRDRVGQMPTELVPHFFESLATSMAATLHISVQGHNAHHMVEVCFKAVGRALRQAIRLEGSELPSTKGVLS